MPATRLSARHLVLLRALFAVAAALMITFSIDHSVAVGFAVFSGFAMATGITHVLDAWLVNKKGARWASILLASISILAGMVSGIPDVRTPLGFWIVVPIWALLVGVVELTRGIQQRRAGHTADGRDNIITAVLALLLTAAVLLIPIDFHLDYYIDDAGQWFELTGEILATGMLGGYAAILGVFLFIAGLSPATGEPAERTSQVAS